MIEKNNFNWDRFLQPYELAVEGFILKFEGIKKQYQLNGLYCPIEIVSGRVKSIDSILDKAKRMNVPFEKIDEALYDIGGVRITCKYIDDVYVICDLIKARKDIKVIEVRDYIKNMKASGYRSLHILAGYNVETISGQVPVKLEFQIRTHAMHFWASIEHSLKYKYQKNIPLDLKERLYHVAITGAKLDDEMTTLHHLIQEYDSLSDDGNNNDPLEEEINMNSLKRW
ncbi:MAG: GTP pyrophosphokinase family protein [Bacilli bacterium]